MDNRMFALGAGICVFLLLLVALLAFRRFVFRMRWGGPRWDWLQNLMVHPSLGLWVLAALMLSLVFGLTVAALTHPPAPPPPPCCSTLPGVDPTLKAQMQELVIAQQRAADALDRIADKTPDVRLASSKSRPGKVVWGVLLLALILVGGGMWLLLRPAKPETKTYDAAAVAAVISGSLLGGLALVGELHVAPRIEFSLLKWMDTRRMIVRGPQNVKHEASPAPARGVRLTCLDPHRVGPFESKAWAISVDEATRLNAWIAANRAWGYLLIGSTDPRGYRHPTFPRNNAELAQARAETAKALIEQIDVQPAPILIALNTTLPVARLIEADETREAAREVLICPLTT